MSQKISLAIAGALAGVFAFNNVSSAAFVAGEALSNAGLTGTTEYNGWVQLTSGKYPGRGTFPGSAMWAAIPSDRAADNSWVAGAGGDANLVKIGNGAAGGPYPASGSIYYGSFGGVVNTYGGELAAVDNTPVANVKSIVFQIQIGEASTYDFFNHVLPTFNYNGGSQQIAPNASVVVDKFDNGTVEMPSGTETVYINTYKMVWDVSGIVDPITSISVNWKGVEHAQLYSLQLDQSDVAGATVPEPGMLGAGVPIIVALAARRRRRG